MFSKKRRCSRSFKGDQNKSINHVSKLSKLAIYADVKTCVLNAKTSTSGITRKIAEYDQFQVKQVKDHNDLKNANKLGTKQWLNSNTRTSFLETNYLDQNIVENIRLFQRAYQYIHSAVRNQLEYAKLRVPYKSSNLLMRNHGTYQSLKSHKITLTTINEPTIEMLDGKTTLNILKEMLYKVRCLKSNEDMILALTGQFKQLSHEPENFQVT